MNGQVCAVAHRAQGGYNHEMTSQGTPFDFVRAQHATPRRRRALSLLCALSLPLLLARCECGPEDVAELNPEIVVNPDEVNLGDRGVNVNNNFTIEIGNVGNALLSISDVRIASDPSAEDFADEAPIDLDGVAFSVLSFPETVDRDTNELIQLNFVPVSQGFFAGMLEIASDDPERPLVQVPLRGFGGQAEITLEPDAIDFGIVNEGPGSARLVRVTNSGFDTLEITGMQIEGEGATTGGPASAFAIDPEVPQTALLEIGESLDVTVRMNPTASAVGAAAGEPLLGELVVESNAANAPRATATLTGTANLAPDVVAVELRSRQTEVKVGLGRPVVVDGSETQDPEGDTFTFSWTLVSAPEASQAFLLNGPVGDACTNNDGCAFDEGYLCVETADQRCRQVMRTRVTPDVVGTFVVRLRGTDSRGAFRDAEVTILPRDLAVVLRWETASDAACQENTPEYCADLPFQQRQLECCGQTDLDLHLIRPEGTLGDYGTCPSECLVTVDGLPVNQCVEDSEENIDICRQYGTDAAYANRYPEWGVVGRADDPRLDIDDIRGAGPEVITLDRPADGAYTAVVHFCTDRITEPTLANLDVYVSGELVHTAGPQRIDAQGQAWIASTLIRSGGPEAGTWSFVSPPGLFDDDAPTDLCDR